MRPTAIAIHRLAVQNTKRYFCVQKALQNPPQITPPPTPRTIVCIGRNYANHISELGNTRPAEPFFFLKPVGSLLNPPKKEKLFVAKVGETVPKVGETVPKVGEMVPKKVGEMVPKKVSMPRKNVLMPKGCDLNYEVELAVILSKNIDEWNESMGELKDIVWGYKVAIDMTARNYQTSAKEKGLPWTLSKGLKTFLPVSKFIPRNEIPDPHNVQLYLEVNGEKRQEDSTNLMIFDIPKLVRHVTSVMPLAIGDMLLTGTPKGVGKVMPGDVITAGVRVDGKELELGKIKVGIVERVSGYGSEQGKGAIEKGLDLGSLDGGKGAAEKEAPQGS